MNEPKEKQEASDKINFVMAPVLLPPPIVTSVRSTSPMEDYDKIDPEKLSLKVANTKKIIE